MGSGDWSEHPDWGSGQASGYDYHPDSDAQQAWSFVAEHSDEPAPDSQPPQPPDERGPPSLPPEQAQQLRAFRVQLLNNELAHLRSLQEQRLPETSRPPPNAAATASSSYTADAGPSSLGFPADGMVSVEAERAGPASLGFPAAGRDAPADRGLSSS
eukprot:1898364-Pyramimonas_sp.AAC.1